MAKNSDDLFRKEFKAMMTSRFSMWGYDEKFSVQNLKVPQMASLQYGKDTDGAVIFGIQEPYFSNLNKKIVEIEGRQAWVKRLYDSHGNFLKDAHTGKVMTKDVPVPHDSVVVSSAENIRLPNTKTVGVSKVQYEPSEGFRYIDFDTVKGGRKYYYIVPKKNVYRLNMCALVLSKRALGRRDRYYRGYKIALQNGTWIYIYVLPVVRRQTSYRVLSVKPSPDFQSDITTLVKWWQTRGYTFNYDDCLINNENVAYIYLEGTISDDEYKPYGASLAVVKEVGMAGGVLKPNGSTISQG